MRFLLLVGFVWLFCFFLKQEYALNTFCSSLLSPNISVLQFAKQGMLNGDTGEGALSSKWNQEFLELL